MTARARIAAYGSALLLVIAGIVVLAAIAGTGAQVVAFVLIGLGFVAVTGLVFLEVGLSEDREREREQAAQARERRRPRLKRPLRRLGRMRGERRRLK
jgi:fatty acid desaturase